MKLKRVQNADAPNYPTFHDYWNRSQKPFSAVALAAGLALGGGLFSGCREGDEGGCIRTRGEPPEPVPPPVPGGVVPAPPAPRDPRPKAIRRKSGAVPGSPKPEIRDLSRTPGQIAIPTSSTPVVPPQADPGSEAHLAGKNKAPEPPSQLP